MPTAVSNTRPSFEMCDGGGWRFSRWAAERVTAGVTDRRTERSQLVSGEQAPQTTVEAGQVHGGSIAAIGRVGPGRVFVQGADALLTSASRCALLIRTADCLPILIADPLRGAIGIAHAGWHGLARQLPGRVVAAFRRFYGSPAEDLWVAIGPAIHACCYEVGPEFSAHFPRFVSERQGRRTCDLIGVAVDQLARSGVRRERVMESGRCTACEPQHWFSVRREGNATGRLISFVMLRN